MDRDGRREIALFGIDPNREYLLSEILRTYGIGYHSFSSADQARAWIEGGPKGPPLLITESDPEGRIPAAARRLRARFPTLRVLPLPSDFKPSELLSLIGPALLSRPATRSESQGNLSRTPFPDPFLG
jgi:hypothetical protein